jgi:hypothetical protein
MILDAPISISIVTRTGDGIWIGELDTKSYVEGAAMESFISL